MTITDKKLNELHLTKLALLNNAPRNVDLAQASLDAFREIVAAQKNYLKNCSWPYAVDESKQVLSDTVNDPRLKKRGLAGSVPS